MGRKAKFSGAGRLDRRPGRSSGSISSWRRYEGVQRVVSEVGIEPIVFGSDFPHGEGLARPGECAQARLGGFDDEQVSASWRDNFEDFFVASL